MPLKFNYLVFQFMEITDKADFYKTSSPEITKLKNLVSGCTRIFKVPDKNILVSVSKTEGEKVYKLEIIDQKKVSVGIVYYIPKEIRLDIYDTNPQVPLVCWKNKRCVWKGFSDLLQRLDMERLFQPLIIGL